jgi:biotin carboxylase
MQIMEHDVERYRGLAGRAIALVETAPGPAAYRAVRRARRFGARIVLLTADPTGYRPVPGHPSDPLSDVDEVVTTDTNDVAKLTWALTSAAGRPTVDAVLSFSDYYCAVAARVAHALGLPGPPPEAAEAGVHKHLLRERTADRPYAVRHVLARESRELPAAADALGFPLIAKPPAEANSVGVHLVRDLPQLRRAFTELHARRTNWRGQPCTGDVLLEEFLTGEEVSVETLTFDGRTRVYGTTSKTLAPPPGFVERAHSFPHDLGAERTAAVEAVVLDMLATVGYRHGPCHTEVKLTPAGPRVVEMNPRLPGHHTTTMIEDVTGACPFLDAMLAATGQPPRPPDAPRGGAAIALLYPPHAGRLQGFDGVADAEAEPGVRFVTLTAAAGEAVRPPTDNYAALGCVYAHGTDAGDALTRAERARDRIAVRVAPAGEGSA